MAEPSTHERDTLAVMPFTILYAVFDQKSGKTRSHRIPALSNRAPAERQFDLMPTASSVKVYHT